jgi:hypothetical protein
MVPRPGFFFKPATLAVNSDLIDEAQLLPSKIRAVVMVYSLNAPSGFKRTRQ